MSKARNIINRARSIFNASILVFARCCIDFAHILIIWTGFFDLLDLVLLLSFSLLTTGAYLLWGAGWACMMLGGLLLGLVLVGIPVKPKS